MPLPRGWYPVGGGLQAAYNGIDPNLPGTPAAMGPAPGLWSGHGYGVACVPPTGATCSWHRISVVETPLHRRTADVLYFLP